MLIIDDLTRSGGTIAECALACKANGAKYVHAFVAHAVFPNGEEAQFMPDGKFAGSVDIFWTTNSLPHVAQRLPKELFEVIDLAQIVSASGLL